MTMQTETSDSRPGRGRSRTALLLLIFIFITPVLLAWLVFYVFPEWQPKGTTNHGVLVEPIRALPEFSLRTLEHGEIERSFLRGKWTLVYPHTGKCERSCVDRLYTLRQVRLAQGKNIDRLQRLMLWRADSESEEARGQLQTHFPGLVIVPLSAGAQTRLWQTFDLEGNEALPDGRAYLVDPLGNLMMYHDADQDPGGMIKDLEKLLKWSGLG